MYSCAFDAENELPLERNVLRRNTCRSWAVPSHSRLQVGQLQLVSSLSPSTLHSAKLSSLRWIPDSAHARTTTAPARLPVPSLLPKDPPRTLPPLLLPKPTPQLLRPASAPLPDPARTHPLPSGSSRRSSKAVVVRRRQRHPSRVRGSVSSARPTTTGLWRGTMYSREWGCR